MRTLVESHLGLSEQALAVLAVLARREPDFAPYDKEFHDYEYEVATAAWYNGRERGVSLVISKGITKAPPLVITFGEHRNSDNIFIDSWVGKQRFLNPPTIADFPDAAYEARTLVEYGRVDRAVEVIIGKIRDYFANLAVEAFPLTPEKPPTMTLDLDDEEPPPAVDGPRDFVSHKAPLTIPTRAPTKEDKAYLTSVLEGPKGLVRDTLIGTLAAMVTDDSLDPLLQLLGEHKNKP